MHRLYLTLLLAITALTTTAQSKSFQDSVIHHIPVYDGKITYADSIPVQGRSRQQLKAAANNWFHSYFKQIESAPIPAGTDTTNVYLYFGYMNYKFRPSMVNIPAVIRMQVAVECRDGEYVYRISNIYFRPNASVWSDLGFQNDPNKLLAAFNQKHLKFRQAWNYSRGNLRDYLFKTDAAVKECIAALHKAMTN